jgi:hypothetical protein
LFSLKVNLSLPYAEALKMPTMTMCERCEAPLDESLNWCSRCFLDVPWASESWGTHPADASEWPNIWEGHPDREVPKDWRDPEWDALTESLSPTQISFWPLRKVVATVALLLAGATLTAMFVPEQVVGLVALVTSGTMALFVVRRAWPGEPHSG